MTRPTGKKPRLPDDSEQEIYNAWHGEREWRGIKRPAPKELAATLVKKGLVGSLRSVNRRYAEYGEEDANRGSARWRLTDATSADELALILPAVVSSARQGRELSKDEAAIFVAFRRALPLRHPDFLLNLTHDYDRAQRRELSMFPSTWAPYTVNEIEEWVAFAHLDQEHPGSLERAMEEGAVRKINAWMQVGSQLVHPLTHSCGGQFRTRENYARHAKDCDGTPIATKAAPKRKGGTGHDKTRKR